MSDNSVPIGSYRGIQLRKLRAFAGVPALYHTETGDICTSLRFAIHIIDEKKGGKK